METSLVSVING